MYVSNLFAGQKNAHPWLGKFSQYRNDEQSKNADSFLLDVRTTVVHPLSSNNNLLQPSTTPNCAWPTTAASQSKQVAPVGRNAHDIHS